jgi:hypothetical protein
LGLSFVRQIIETHGGKIEVNSEPSIGTKLTVKLALTRPEPSDNKPSPSISPQRAQFQTFLKKLRGRNICLLQRPLDSSPQDPGIQRSIEGLARFTNVLANTLQKHLKMNLVRTTNADGHGSDIVIVPELSFEYLALIRRSRIENGKAPVTIFVAMDALEAATLRSDARVRSKESVVEIMTQPYAYCFSSCS